MYLESQNNLKFQASQFEFDPPPLSYQNSGRMKHTKKKRRIDEEEIKTTRSKDDEENLKKLKQRRDEVESDIENFYN